MRLVVDTNIIMAALIKNSVSRKIIISGKLELVTAGFAIEELKGHKKEILDKAGTSEAEMQKLLAIFFKKIYIVEDWMIKDQETEARGIMDRVDPDDSPFVALALAIRNDGIWSNDAHFKEQKRIKIFTTENLVKLYKIK